jgi:GAF domain-containing protein
MVAIHIRHDNAFPGRARYGVPPEMVEALSRIGQVMGCGSLVGRTIAEGRPVHIPDAAADHEYTNRDFTRITGARSMLGVPLMRDGRSVGLLSLYRTRVSPFTERQIELMATFASVIAIENTRLFEEVQARTRELTESLEYQTATSELLKVIGRSTFDLKPVFETLIESAVKLCGATRGFISRFDGKLLRFAAGYNVTPELTQYFEQNPFAVDRHSNTGRAAIERRTVHNIDVRADPEYTYGGSQVDPYRTVLAIPMLKANALLGVILIYRHEVLPFTDNQIALIETFADQAVIAIENARLFEEVQARTQELTRSLAELKALAETGRAVSASLDLDKVLPTILEHACEISETGGGAIYVFDKAKGEFHLEAGRNMSDELITCASDPARRNAPRPVRCTARGRRDRGSGRGAAAPAVRVAPEGRRARHARRAAPTSGQGSRSFGGAPQERRPLPAGDGCTAPILRLTVGDRHRQCAPVQRGRGDGPRIGAGEPAQVTVRGQYEP